MLRQGGLLGTLERAGYQPVSQLSDTDDTTPATINVAEPLVGNTFTTLSGGRSTFLEVWQQFARGYYTIVPRPEGHWFLDTWDMIVIFALGATAVLLPFEVALLEEVPRNLYTVDRLIDLVFVSDIVLTFFVAIYNVHSDQYVVTPLDIARFYMAVPFSSNFTAGWFWPDVLTVFPWDSVPAVAHMSSLRMVRVLRLVRMLRLVRVVKLFNRWKISSGVPNFCITVATCFMCTLLLLHWLACIWGHLGLNPPDNEDSWLSNHLTDAHHITDMPVRKVYSIALYFCTVVLTTVGFGDVLPVNVVEVRVMIFTIFLTSITWAWVVATVVDVITNMDVFGTYYNRIMDDMNNLMRLRDISRPLRFKVRRHIQNAYNVERNRHHHAAIQWLSEGLQGELAIESGMERTCKGIWYMNDLEDHIKIELADEFNGELFSPTEYIMHRDNISVIVRGSCLRKGKVISRWAVFFEDAILVSDHLRDTACPRTLSFVEVMAVHVDRLKHTCVKFPEFDRRLRKAQVKLALWRSFVLTAERKMKLKKRGLVRRSTWDFYLENIENGQDRPARRVATASWASSFDAQDTPLDGFARQVQNMQDAISKYGEMTHEGIEAIRDCLSGTQIAIRGVEGRIDNVESQVQALSEVVQEAVEKPSPPSHLGSINKHSTKSLFHTEPTRGPR